MKRKSEEAPAVENEKRGRKKKEEMAEEICSGR